VAWMPGRRCLAGTGPCVSGRSAAQTPGRAGGGHAGSGKAPLPRAGEGAHRGDGWVGAAAAQRRRHARRAVPRVRLGRERQHARPGHVALAGRHVRARARRQRRAHVRNACALAAGPVPGAAAAGGPARVGFMGFAKARSRRRTALGAAGPTGLYRACAAHTAPPVGHRTHRSCWRSALSAARSVGVPLPTESHAAACCLRARRRAAERAGGGRAMFQAISTH